jgi:hypothetical protein
VRVGGRIHIGEIHFAVPVCECVMNKVRLHLCCKQNVISMGTIGGINSIQVSYKEGYFHINVAMYMCDVAGKINSYGFMYTVHAPTITCILH